MYSVSTTVVDNLDTKCIQLIEKVQYFFAFIRINLCRYSQKSVRDRQCNIQGGGVLVLLIQKIISHEKKKSDFYFQVQGYWCLMRREQYFSYFMAVNHFGGGNRRIQRKPLSCNKAPTILSYNAVSSVGSMQESN